ENKELSALSGKDAFSAGNGNSIRDESRSIAATRSSSGALWWQMESEEVTSFFNVCPQNGLTEESVRANLFEYGANVFPTPGCRSSLQIFLDQFASVPIILLGVAAGLSVITGGLIDAAIISSVILLNGVIGFVTESEAEKTINSLRDLVRPTAEVVRQSSKQVIAAEQVVCGDILTLKPGSYIPADARLVESQHLSVDESILTGESLPSAKISDSLKSGSVPIAERQNMVFAGTRVTGGQGRAVVVAVGVTTEVGKIQILVSDTEQPATPIEKQLTVVGNQLTAISAIVCFAIFVIGLFRGIGLLEMMKTGISLAVAALPEGLPAVATTTLALGVRSMKSHGVLVRDLDAVCALGSVQTICFDKTGTVTLNQMTVTRVFTGMKLINIKDGIFQIDSTYLNPYSSDELVRLLHVCVLCSETHVESSNGSVRLRGSATENALVSMAIAAGVNVEEVRSQHPTVERNYRAENQLFMRTLHETDKGTMLAVKGSPQEVLEKCVNFVRDGVVYDLTEGDRDEIDLANDRMAGDGLRVLGIACAYGHNGDSGINCSNWTWLGLAGMEDPVRDGVKKSIEAFHNAGIDTVMITGDQGSTAFSVGKELDLSKGAPLEIVDSIRLEESDPILLRALCNKAHVFSRVSPADKLQIVKALQSSGKVVAVAGDGINDGPALKTADIGIAMGATGTDVAREVADIVLEEDDLETLIVALSDGRTTYNNIRKSLHYLLATNFSEIVVMLFSSVLSLGYPLNAIQLLWINLISDVFPGLALALDPPEPDVLSQPPRHPGEPIVTKEDFKQIAIEANILSISSLSAYGYGVSKYGLGPTAGVFAFQSLTISQILHALSCRSKETSIFFDNS
ncbi:MAG: cation-translocating P-type ATPase, partial [Candidatus Kryptoniota bacterium]